MIETLIFVNNFVSAGLARAVIERDGLDYARVALIKLRHVPVPWAERCGLVLDYGRPPELTLQGQARFLPYYRRGARTLRGLLGSGTLRRVFLVNNDNLLTNHVLRWAEQGGGAELAVLAEGFMNFQEIGLANRAGWRWRAKPWVARSLGLSYREPTTHLSGAFEPAVSRVVSFAAAGLKAPPGKVDLIPFPRVTPRVPADPEIGLIVHTGLWQWMPAEAYAPFAQAMAAWVRSFGFKKLYAKAHPHIPTGPIEALLPPHELIGAGRSLEDMAPDLEAGTVIGACCTGLVTLKLLRPELRCLDFGADYYCSAAYHGDHGILTLLRAADVEITPSAILKAENEGYLLAIQPLPES